MSAIIKRFNRWRGKDAGRAENVLERAGVLLELNSMLYDRLGSIRDKQIEMLSGQPFDPNPDQLVDVASMPHAAPASDAEYLKVYIAWQTLMRIVQRGRELNVPMPAIENEVARLGNIVLACGFKDSAITPRTPIVVQTQPPWNMQGNLPPTRESSLDFKQLKMIEAQKRSEQDVKSNSS
jgi:hypothetical protein